MTSQAKDAHGKTSWAASRLPFMGAFCAAFCQKNLAPDAPYLAAFPFLIAATLALLTLSGVVEAVYYNPWHAFDSVQFINRSVNNGWLVHAYHATGTTMIFALTYVYVLRSMLTRSYRAPGEFTWMLTVKLLAVLLLTGWLGYVLTGGAAGYWSLFRASNAALSLGGLPGAVGLWFFGGPAGGSTLARLEVFHALLALSLLLVVWLLHASHRNTAPQNPPRAVAFYPYYVAQYFAALAVFALIFAFLAFYEPHLGSSPLNAVPADTLAVSLGGLPWYLTPVAKLAGVFPSAMLGLLAVIAAGILLYALPWLDRSGATGRPGKLYGFFIWLLALDVLGLGLSCSPVLTGLFTIWFFFHFLVLTPLVTSMEAE